MLVVLLAVGAVRYLLNGVSLREGFEITDDLGGNIFPSAILSVATTDAQVIIPGDSLFVGNPKGCIAVRLRSGAAFSRIRIELEETPFFRRSVSEFVLERPATEYVVYPDVIWNYEALRGNSQAEPVADLTNRVKEDKIPVGPDGGDERQIAGPAGAYLLCT